MSSVQNSRFFPKEFFFRSKALSDLGDSVGDDDVVPREANGFPYKTESYRPGIISSRRPLKYSVSGNVGSTG